ncbi:MAG TPA: hypothetical protein PK743_11220 [Luteimonas sp.]|nr:hypothetical protein [Luteimonas sp.]
MSATDVMPPHVWAFYNEHMQSPTHRKMTHIGMALTKVTAMFGVVQQPPEAMAIFVLLLEGLESGDASFEARAMAIYRKHIARRELH